MSNFSEVVSRQVADHEDEPRLLAKILAGVAFECAAMANDIAELGAHISGSDTGTTADTQQMIRLQAFDRITQSAHAQAQIIAHVARDLLTRRAPDREYLLSMVDGIPLYDVRARLRESISGLPAHGSGTPSGDLDDWS